MMHKRDPIFWTASAVFALGVALAAVDNAFLLLLVGAYLLRPTLHSLGYFRRLIDERQLQIQYRASNVAFATMVLGVILVMLVLIRRDDHTWEMLVAVLMVSLAVRALAGLLMVGDLIVAGRRIILAVGLLLALFGAVESVSDPSGIVAHVAPGMAIAGLGLLSTRYPRPVAALFLTLASALVAWLVFRTVTGIRPPRWGEVLGLSMLGVPLAVAGGCLIRGARPHDDVQPTAVALLLIGLMLAVPPRAWAIVAPASAAVVLPQDSIPCAEISSTHRTGGIKRCTLTREHLIGAQLLPPGSEVDLHETGTLARIVLGAEASVFGQVLPAKTKLFFDRDGRMRFFWLHEDAVVQGHRIPGQGDGQGNRLHPNGALRAIWLVGDQEIDGVPCTSSGNVLRMGLGVISLGTKRMAWFHDNGRLQQAMLSRDAVIQGHAFRKGDLINLRRDGTLDLAAAKLR